MPKKYVKRAKEQARQRATMAATQAPTRPKHKRRRLTDGLIGISSAAILAVYGLGYLNTQNATGAIGSVSVVPTPIPSQGVPGLPSAAPLAPGTYRDGTYKAVGTSRHGDIEATVVVSNGKISSAKVSGCDTRYPCSDVDPLVDEVVSRQGAPVHYMSGATDSSKAYTQAIKAALAQAS